MRTHPSVRAWSIDALVVSALSILVFGFAPSAAAQSTAFSYTGSLKIAGVPANGNYDMKFTLFTAASGGNASPTITLNGVAVANGIFTVSLDFISPTFTVDDAFSGADVYLEVAISNGQGGFTTLTPRTKIASTPYAVRALTVNSGQKITARSFFNQDQSFVADRFGNLRAHGINVGPPDGSADTFVVQDTGAVTAKGINLTDNTFFALSGGVVGVNGNLTVTGSLSVSGAKNSIVKLPDGRWVALSAMESPGTWFEDFGTVRLHNGRATVRIDATFAQTANLSVPYMVYITPDGDCRGLYVRQKSNTSFEVRELRGGRSNVEFDYRIVARRKGYESTRFAPVAPAASVRK